MLMPFLFQLTVSGRHVFPSLMAEENALFLVSSFKFAQKQQRYIPVSWYEASKRHV